MFDQQTVQYKISHHGLMLLSVAVHSSCIFLNQKWAATRQNQQNECAPSEDSDQPGHPSSLIRVFAVHMKKAWVLSYPLSVQRRLWSDWADAQADLSLRWAHTYFVGFVMSWLKSYRQKRHVWIVSSYSLWSVPSLRWGGGFIVPSCPSQYAWLYLLDPCIWWLSINGSSQKLRNTIHQLKTEPHRQISEALPRVLENRGTRAFISGETREQRSKNKGKREQRQFWGTENIGN